MSSDQPPMLTALSVECRAHHAPAGFPCFAHPGGAGAPFHLPGGVCANRTRRALRAEEQPEPIRKDPSVVHGSGTRQTAPPRPKSATTPPTPEFQKRALPPMSRWKR